jgi:hypothetical protein
MKAKRFIIEYANYKLDEIANNTYMNGGIQTELMRRIDRAVRMVERGMITIDECIRIINNPGNGEDLSEYYR